MVSPWDEWRPGSDDPTIAAGFRFDIKSDGWPDALSEETLKQQLPDVVLAPNAHGTVGHCVKTRSLSDLLPVEGNLGDQARSAAEWAAQAIKDIASTGGGA